MIGRNASAVRIRRASAATSTSPNSQCSVFPLASGPRPPPHSPFTGGSFPRRSFLAPGVGVRGKHSPVAAGALWLAGRPRRASICRMVQDPSLTEDEHLVLRLHPHWKTLIGPLSVAVQPQHQVLVLGERRV